MHREGPPAGDQGEGGDLRELKTPCHPKWGISDGGHVGCESCMTFSLFRMIHKSEFYVQHLNF